MDDSRVPSQDEIFKIITCEIEQPSREDDAIGRFLHSVQSPLWGSPYFPPPEAQRELFPVEYEDVRVAVCDVFEFEEDSADPYGTDWHKLARLLSRAVYYQAVLTEATEGYILEEPDDCPFEYPAA